MNTLLVLFAALPQAPIPQAQLHPENALLFAELPDMQGLLAAYGSVASARLLRDEEVRAAMGELWSSVEADVDSALDELAQKTGLSPQTVRSPVATLAGYLDQVSGASLSVSLAEAHAGEGAETIRRMHAGVAELRTLEDAIYLHAVENEGRYPSGLADLGPDVAEAVDPWSRPYAYTLRADGGGFDLGCLGADGAGGGLGPDTDLTARSDVVLLITHELERRIGATLCATFRRPEDAQRALALLQGLASKAQLQRAEGATAPPGADLTWYAPPSGIALPIWMMRAGGLLAIGAGSSDPAELIVRSTGKAPSALASAGYRNLEARLGDRGGASVARAFLEVADLVGALRKAMPVEVVNLTFVEPYARSVWRTGIENGRFVTETFALPAGEHNLVAQCIAHQPVPEEIWKYVPAEAVGVYATTIDAPRLFQLILEALQTDFDEVHVSKLSKLEEQYGFSLERDVFGSMGAGAAGYLLPLSGLMSLPGMALVVKLHDPERFQKGLEGLLKLLEDQSGGEFKVQYKPYREVPLWYFSFENTGAPIPISPSLVIQEDHLFVTLTSTRAKKEIKRLQDLAAPATPSPPEPSDATGGAVAPAEPAVATPPVPPAIHAARARAPADATAVGYMDWAQVFAGAYDGGKAALALMGGGLDLPFDPTLLPEAELFTQFYEPSFYWSRASEESIYSRGESSLGPEAVLGVIGVAGVATVVVKEAIEVRHAPEREVMAVETVTTEPAVQETQGPEAHQAATRESLRFLATRLAVYKLELKRYPARLEDLLQPTGSFPRGFLDGGKLPRDAWQNAFSYSAAGDGSGYRLWSLGPDGVDQSGEGDDLVN